MTNRVCSATHRQKDGQLEHTCWVWVTRHAGYALSVLHQWHGGYWRIAVWSRCRGKPSIRTRVASLKTESVVTRTTKENRKVQAGSTNFNPGWKYVQQSTTKITNLLSMCQLTLATYDCPCWGWYIGVFQCQSWHLIWDYTYVYNSIMG